MVYSELVKVISENKDNVISACDAVLTLILEKNAGEQREYFETFLKEVSIIDIGVDDFNIFFAPMRKGNITSEQLETDQLGDRIISNLIKKNASEKEFYDDLWRRLTDDVLSGDRESKNILLVRFWVDPRIPYYHFSESCTMDDEEYRKVLDSIEEPLKKAIFVIYAGFPQKTQKASLLMSIANEIEDDRSKAVYWSVVLDQESIWQQRSSLDSTEEAAEDAN